MRTLTLLLTVMVISFTSCKKNGPDAASNVTPVDSTNNNNNNNSPDSFSVVTRIDESLGDGYTYFTYDTVNRRYTNWYYYYSSYNYDSVFAFYNGTGQISSLVEKKPIGSWPYTEVQVAVYQYSGVHLSKIYLKQKEDNPVYTPTYNTDISNPYLIASYDSMVYNGNQLTASYKFSGVPATLFSYQKFFYDPANDSLLQKIEYYQSNGGGYPLSDVLNLSTYDTKTNPLYRDFKLFGLYPFVPMFNVLPGYYVSSYQAPFATFSPHNCTKSGSDITYTYNSEGLPQECYIGVPPTHEWVRFNYKKYKN